VRLKLALIAGVVTPHRLIIAMNFVEMAS